MRRIERLIERWPELHALLLTMIWTLWLSLSSRLATRKIRVSELMLNTQEFMASVCI